jgi:hypothetical protein
VEEIFEHRWDQRYNCLAEMSERKHSRSEDIHATAIVSGEIKMDTCSMSVNRSFIYFLFISTNSTVNEW